MNIKVDEIRTEFLLEDCHVGKLSDGRSKRESEIHLWKQGESSRGR